MRKKIHRAEDSLASRKLSPREPHQYSTDDPVACEEFVRKLLAHGFGVDAIKHDGMNLKANLDCVVNVAAAEVASWFICACLKIKPDKERFRFSFAA